MSRSFSSESLHETGGLDALVELLAGGYDLLANVLALSVNDGLRYLYSQ